MSYVLCLSTSLPAGAKVPQILTMRELSPLRHQRVMYLDASKQQAGTAGQSCCSLPRGPLKTAVANRQEKKHVSRLSFREVLEPYRWPMLFGFLAAVGEAAADLLEP